ncbi:endonuclease domain-containing protein [Actinacidiphila paucisporea]|uniref:endonuclease domain-containing protein n=1 Tax=Actinacidiphila paucisporea TaxID=310782 RepID=UPI000D1B8069
MARHQDLQAHGPNVPACWKWPVVEQTTHGSESATISYLRARTVRKPSRNAMDIPIFARWQAGRCAICGDQPWAAPAPDIDLNTGLLRGLLCGSCLIALKLGDKRSETAAYLYRPARLILWEAGQLHSE